MAHFDFTKRNLRFIRDGKIGVADFHSIDLTLVGHAEYNMQRIYLFILFI